MLNSKFFEKWWFRAFIALIIFFTWQIFYAISKVQSLDEEKLTLQATIEVLTRRTDNLRLEIFEKERTVTRLKNKAEEIDELIRDHISLIPKGRATDPMIYFITPTNFRPAQKADLTRLSYTLSHVPNLHWIVIEDSDKKSKGIAEILERSKIKYTHLAVKTPDEKKMKYNDPNWYLPRGVDQRNAALLWIRNQLSNAKTGAIYFGDDDNTYDLRLFKEIRKIREAGVWPVGIVGGLIVETPILAPNGTIIDFNANWKKERPFPIDMAAFGVNITVLLANNQAMFNYNVPRGYQESTFLEKLGINRSNMEPLAEKCTKVYVWHTRTEKSKLSKDLIKKFATKTGFDPLEAEAVGIEFE